jgi:hypothetical protein
VFRGDAAHQVRAGRIVEAAKRFRQERRPAEGFEIQAGYSTKPWRTAWMKSV